MAYNKLNFLTRVYIFQEYYKIEAKRGITSKRIWENITVLFPISQTTFFRYMGLNVRHDLRQMGIDFNELNKKKDYVIKAIQLFTDATVCDTRDKAHRLVQ